DLSVSPKRFVSALTWITGRDMPRIMAESTSNAKRPGDTAHRDGRGFGRAGCTMALDWRILDAKRRSVDDPEQRGAEDTAAAGHRRVGQPAHARAHPLGRGGGPGCHHPARPLRA